MPRYRFALVVPTQAQLEEAAGPGVTVAPVTPFPNPDPVDIDTDDVTEGADSRIADRLQSFGYTFVGLVEP